MSDLNSKLEIWNSGGVLANYPLSLRTSFQIDRTFKIFFRGSMQYFIVTSILEIDNRVIIFVDEAAQPKEH